MPSCRRAEVRGPLLMVAAALAFTAMVVCVKVARRELDAFQIVFWRSFGSIPLAALLLRRGPWRLRNPRWFLLRLALGFAAMTCFYTAARGLGVADLALVNRLQPVGVALLAPGVLGAGERAGPRVWACSLLGLLGCAVLLGPELALGRVAGLWALGAVGFSTFAHLAVRRLGATDRARTIVFWLQVGVTLLSGAVLVVRDGGLPAPPPPRTLAWVLAIGVLATVGQLLMTRAYAVDRASRVAAASHVTPLWGVLADALAFGVLPGPRVLAGGALVMAAVVALVHPGVAEGPGGRGGASGSPPAGGTSASARSP